MMNDHGVELVGVPPLDDWSAPRKQWVILGKQAWNVTKGALARVGAQQVARRCMIILIAVDLFVGQLTVKVVLDEGEVEGELDIVGEFALKLVEALHLDD